MWQVSLHVRATAPCGKTLSRAIVKPPLLHFPLLPGSGQPDVYTFNPASGIHSLPFDS